MARKKDDIREDRIAMEAVVDAYDSGERAMGWYYYLDGKLKFPFKARCRLVRSISSLRVGEEVEVLGMAPEEECDSEMFCLDRAGRRPNRRSIGATATIIERSRHPDAVGDWLYWIDRGYEM